MYAYYRLSGLTIKPQNICCFSILSATVWNLEGLCFPRVEVARGDQSAARFLFSLFALEAATETEEGDFARRKSELLSHTRVRECMRVREFPEKKTADSSMQQNKSEGRETRKLICVRNGNGFPVSSFFTTFFYLTATAIEEELAP